MKDLTLTEEMFLLTVWKLKEEAYGVTIRQHVSQETGRTFPYGTLYSALDKLVRLGYLKKTTGDPSPERGGRRKFFYHITEDGIEALKNALALKQILWDTETQTNISKS
jgi:DNA-binding PadR family transcriptional regulator